MGPCLTGGEDPLVAALRAAGCVFAEEEAQELRHRARDEAELGEFTRRRVSGEALEHVVGHVRWCGEDLVVAPGVFVPRARTRLLARLVLVALRAAGPDAVLVEPCCGTAPLATLAARRLPGVRVLVTDRDAGALACARENLPDGAGVHQGDLLRVLPAALAGQVDVIAAVPPYVPDGQLALLPREAREQEPEPALLGGADGLDVVRRLLAQAPAVLAPCGLALLEMHRGQAAVAAAEAARHGLTARVHRGGEDGTAVLEARRPAGG